MSTDHLAARVLLGAIGVGFLCAIALPLLFVPLRWARVLGWSLPQEPAHLTRYFARCLGGVSLVITALSLRAALDPVAHRDIVDLLAGAGSLMTVVHVWGAVERSQPPAETAEIGLYALLTVLLCWARTSLQ